MRITIRTKKPEAIARLALVHCPDHAGFPCHQGRSQDEVAHVAELILYNQLTHGKKFNALYEVAKRAVL